jgi:hypothetical protein
MDRHVDGVGGRWVGRGTDGQIVGQTGREWIDKAVVPDTGTFWSHVRISPTHTAIVVKLRAAFTAAFSSARNRERPGKWDAESCVTRVRGGGARASGSRAFSKAGCLKEQ